MNTCGCGKVYDTDFEMEVNVKGEMECDECHEKTFDLCPHDGDPTDCECCAYYPEFKYDVNKEDCVKQEVEDGVESNRSATA